MIENMELNVDPIEVWEAIYLQKEFATKFINYLNTYPESLPFSEDLIFFEYIKGHYNELIKASIPYQKSTLKYNSHHLRFTVFLNENFDQIVKLKKRTDVLKLYSEKENKLIYTLGNQLVSNTDSRTVEATAKLIKEKYPQILTNKCLEIGAGTSPLSKFLGAENSPHYVLSDLRLEYLRNNLTNPKIKFDMNYPLVENDFHSILSTKSIHLAKDKIETLNHLANGVIENGYLIISNANKYICDGVRSPFEIAFSFFPGFVEAGGLITIENYLSYLENSKFKPIDKMIFKTKDEQKIYWIVVAKKVN